jgi:MFS superfamily sulfate permease-like transporter
MMTRSLLLTAAALALASSAEAATKVAVIELGTSGTVHRAASSSPETSAAGVTSFFQALHGRKLQQSGMAVVPDLFNKPESSVVVSISGADLEDMPELNSIMSNEEETVGHLKCHGKKSKTILKGVNNVDTVEDISSLKQSVEIKAKESGLSGVSFQIQKEQAADVDAQVSEMIQDMKKKCQEKGDKVVLHLMIEDTTEDVEESLHGRRLAEDDGDENNGYYGYKYYNAYGELITTYKTMFQIQYFNVVLWTSLGLVGVLTYSFALMLGMPLMPDTLLFGESAKVPLED